MYAAESKKAAALPPCACCSAPASNGFWGTYLCNECFAKWWVDAPMMTALEVEHAAKHPEDIEASGVHQFSGGAWVLLRDGVAEKVAGAFAAAWILRNRKPAIASRVPVGAAR